MREAKVEPPRARAAKVEPPTGDHLRAIGQITANFAVLELVVSLSAWSLIGSDQTLGQIITAELSFRKLLDLLSNLYRLRVNHPQLTEELDGLIAQAAQAEEKRNVITHSYWAAGDTHETSTRVKMTAKRYKGLKHRSEPMSVEALNEIADFIAAAEHHITQFMVRTGIFR